MNKREFYEMLDIDAPEDFQYFENIANYFESDEEPEYEDVAELFKEVDKDVLAQLAGNYFEEITGFIPGSQTEVFTIFENLRRAIVGMCRNCEEDENLTAKLSEELERFRRWYSVESRVYCTDLSTMEEMPMCLRDALATARFEEIEGKSQYEYDFSECMNYPLDEYIVSMGDILASGEEEETPEDIAGESPWH